MELVGNLWPVVDLASGLVQRFFMRAYAMEAPDAIISQTLTALAPSDFLAARVFPVPPHYRYVTEYGTLEGCVSPGAFHRLQSGIIESAMRQLVASGPPLLGINASGGDMRPAGVRPTFPGEPYFVVTTLVEMPDGQLLPQL